MRAIFLLFFILITSLFIRGQIELIIQPGPEGIDSRILSLQPDRNLGDSAKFIAMAWTFSDIYGEQRSLIDFDLSEVPPKSHILNAKLDLFFYSNEPIYVPHTGNNEAYLRPIVSPWKEDVVTWNLMPATSTENQVYLPASAEPEQNYTDIDITILLQNQFNHPDKYFGLMLQLGYHGPYRSLMFASSDNNDPSLRPRLTVTYSCELPESMFTYEVIDATVSFSNTSISAESWHWDFGDGYYSDLQNPTHEYNTFGKYNVCLTASDSCGMDIHCDSIEIFNSGINESELIKMKIFPNPFTSLTTFEYTLYSPAQVTLSIINSFGEMVFQDKEYHQPGMQNIMWDAEVLPAGIYYFRLDVGGRLTSGKLVRLN